VSGQATVGSRKSSLRLTRATTEVIAAQESEVTAKRQRQLEHAVGFANVMQALTTCNKPVVGHNMLLDLAYLYHQFVGHLPPSLDEFRKQVQILFPAGIYDTKYLAGLFPVFLPSTSLEDIYTALASETTTAIGHMDGIVGFDANKISNFLPTAPDDIEKEGVLHATKAPMKSDVLHTLFADLAECSKDVDMQLTKVELPGVVHSSLFDRYKTTGDAPHRYHEAGCVSYGPKRIWHMMLVTFWRFYACRDCIQRMSCCDVKICMHFVSPLNNLLNLPPRPANSKDIFIIWKCNAALKFMAP
jgi:hypothetical protein